MRRLIISILFLTIFHLTYSQVVETGVSWVSTSVVSNQTSPNFNSPCGPINYTISTDVNFTQLNNGAPYNNNCILFPSSNALNGTSVDLNFTFNQPVQNLRIRIIDLDENVNNISAVEEYLTNFNVMPNSITNLGMGIPPCFLTATDVTPNDGNNLNANNNASCWLNWSTTLSSVNFTYFRPGPGYALIVDSIYFECVGCNMTMDLGPDVSTCNGEIVNIDGTIQNATSYLWNNGATTSSISTNVPGEYILTAINANCTVSDTIQLTETVFMPDLIQDNDTVCESDQLALAVNSNYTSYSWSTGATTQSISVSQAGLYWVEVSNGQCEHRDTVLIEEINRPTAINDTSICLNTPVLIDGFLPAVTAYLWSTGETSSSIVILNEGNYTVTRTIASCDFTESFQVSVDDLPNSSNTNVQLCEGETVALITPHSGITYVWNDNQTSNIINVDTSGLFTVQTTLLCGQIIDSFTVILNDCNCTIYLPNTFTPNGDEFNNLYGPVYECAFDQYRLEIFDRWGELIWESYDPDIQWDGTYFHRIVPDGTYTYKLMYSNKNNSEVLEMNGHLNVLR